MGVEKLWISMKERNHSQLLQGTTPLIYTQEELRISSDHTIISLMLLCSSGCLIKLHIRLYKLLKAMRNSSALYLKNPGRPTQPWSLVSNMAEFLVKHE